LLALTRARFSGKRSGHGEGVASITMGELGCAIGCGICDGPPAQSHLPWQTVAQDVYTHTHTHPLMLRIAHGLCGLPLVKPISTYAVLGMGETFTGCLPTRHHNGAGAQPGHAAPRWPWDERRRCGQSGWPTCCILHALIAQALKRTNICRAVLMSMDFLVVKSTRCLSRCLLQHAWNP
jgi:hypothetical protein